MAKCRIVIELDIFSYKLNAVQNYMQRFSFMNKYCWQFNIDGQFTVFVNNIM